MHLEALRAYPWIRLIRNLELGRSGAYHPADREPRVRQIGSQRFGRSGAYDSADRELTVGQIGSLPSERGAAERPDAVRAAGSFQGLDRLRAGDAVYGQARTGLVEGVLALLPDGEVFLGVMVEALGTDHGEAREDLVAGIAVAALRGVVAMAE